MGEIGIRRAILTVVAAIATAVVVGCGDPAASDVVEASQDGSTLGQSACLGVVTSKCNEILGEAQRQGVVSTIRIVCTRPPCTERQGEVTIEVVFANGGQSSWGEGWQTAGGVAPAPAPVPRGPAPTPIEPTPSP
jgi:hypothetical protein